VEVTEQAMDTAEEVVDAKLKTREGFDKSSQSVEYSHTGDAKIS
jgi:hypothetical protein